MENTIPGNNQRKTLKIHIFAEFELNKQALIKINMEGQKDDINASPPPPTSHV